MRRHRGPRLAPAALPGRRRRGPARHRRFRRGRPQQPAAPGDPRQQLGGQAQDRIGQGPHPRDQPPLPGGSLRNGPHQRERPGDHRRLRHRLRRHRQLPHPLPGQRRLRAARQAQRLRLDLPLRGPGHRLQLPGRPQLPGSLPRAAAAGHGALLRRRRRGGRAAGHHRHDPGHRGGEADHRHRHQPQRPSAALRCPEDELPGAEAAPPIRSGP